MPSKKTQFTNKIMTSCDTSNYSATYLVMSMKHSPYLYNSRIKTYLSKHSRTRVSLLLINIMFIFSHQSDLLTCLLALRKQLSQQYLKYSFTSFNISHQRGKKIGLLASFLHNKTCKWISQIAFKPLAQMWDSKFTNLIFKKSLYTLHIGFTY